MSQAHTLYFSIQNVVRYGNSQLTILLFSRKHIIRRLKMGSKKILVLGSGMVARPCVEYLVRDSKNEITVGQSCESPAILIRVHANPVLNSLPNAIDCSDARIRVASHKGNQSRRFLGQRS